MPLQIRVCEAAEWLPLTSLHGLVNNPRKPLTDAQKASLRKSLVKLGLFRPLLVWRDAQGVERVIGGNKKLEQFKELVLSQPIRFVRANGEEAPGIPITRYEGSEELAKLAALRDNNADGDWDYSLLTEMIAELDGLGADMELTGFDADLLDDMMEYGNAAEARLLEAATHDPVEAQPASSKGANSGDDDEPNDGGLTEPGDRLVGVSIGFVRGRIRKATYDEFVTALAPNDLERDKGLDKAFRRHLDYVKRLEQQLEQLRGQQP